MNYLTEIKKNTVTGKHRKSLYRCVCGTEKEIRRDHVNSGKTISCGCYNIKKATTHGMNGTKTQRRWMDMKHRCKPSAESHKRYFDRGIAVCDRWNKFENFYEDMGDCKGLELDRIDNNKGYYKENCRWTTRTVQARNTEIQPHSSKYRGVVFNKARNKWQANITIGGRLIYLGLFGLESEAAIAWNEFAKNYEGFNLNKIE